MTNPISPDLTALFSPTPVKRDYLQASAVERILAASPAVLYAISLEDRQMNNVWTSENVVELLGYTMEEVMKPGWWFSCLHPDDVHLIVENLEHVFPKTKEPVKPGQGITYRHIPSLKYRFRHADGSYRYMHNDGRVVINEDGDPVELIGAWIDITDRYEMEQELRQAQKLEVVGRLAGGIAHDFNNILAAVKLNAEDILTMVHGIPDAMMGIQEILKGATRASELTKQLLAYGRKQVLQPVILDLNDVIKNFGNMMQRMIGDNISVSLSLDPLPQSIKADAGQIEQVLMNLAVNARDAMKNGGKLNITTSTVTLERTPVGSAETLAPGKYVHLIVSDTGVGMSEEVKRHVFEPFYTTKAVGEGSGMGLATVYGIVTQSGGTVTITSMPDIGTEMHVYLPYKESLDKVDAAPQLQLVPTGKAELILLVEDEDSVRKATLRLLRQRGYQVLEATNGDQALDIAACSPERINLVVTDVMMPGISGVELVSRLRRKDPELQALLMSGYSEEAIEREGIFVPGARFLPKPFRIEDLLKVVRELLDKRVIVAA